MKQLYRNDVDISLRGIVFCDSVAWASFVKTHCIASIDTGKAVRDVYRGEICWIQLAKARVT
jgi:hypothetical protein